MITIRTGHNGSYKSAYCAWFDILPALKEGRTVVTNFQGMQPLEVISKELNIVFPESAKLFRIYSKDKIGKELWKHFFCWMPVGSLVVIDECQDIGFDFKKTNYKPIEVFKDNLPLDLYQHYLEKQIRFNIHEIKTNTYDDRQVSDFGDDGLLIYPSDLEESFNQHRKYLWDIQLLSPDWGNIPSNIKACSEECFYHQSRDHFPFCKRKPYIYKHSKTDSKPSIPNKKNSNLSVVHVPVDVHKLYSSTLVGDYTKKIAKNPLLSDKKLISIICLILFCVIYFIYNLSSRFTNDSSSEQIKTEIKEDIKQVNEIPNKIHSVSNVNVSDSLNNEVVYSPAILDLLNLSSVKLTAEITSKRQEKNYSISRKDYYFNIVDLKGGFNTVSSEYFKYFGATINYISDCLIELKKDNFKYLVTCDNTYNQIGNLESSEDDKDTSDLIMF